MKITKEQVLENLDEVKKYVEEVENKKEEKAAGIAIRNRWTGDIIFQSTKTTFKEAVAERLLHDSNLSGSNLSGSDLSGSDLRGSDLSGSNLRGSDLSGADLSGADLSDADLSDAELQHAKFYGRGGTKKLTKAQLTDFLNALGFQVED